MRHIRFDIKDLKVTKSMDEYDKYKENTSVKGICHAVEVDNGSELSVLAKVEFHAEPGQNGYKVCKNDLGPMEFEYMRIHIYTYMMALMGHKYMWMGELINEEVIVQVEAYKMNLL